MGKAIFAGIILLAVGAAIVYCSSAKKATADNDAPRETAEPPKFWEDPSFREALAGSGKLGTKGITIVAPGSGLGDENAKKAHAIAESLGVRFPDEALKQGVVPYNANSDDIRLEQLRRALNDPDTEIVWALRGGYGSMRLLEALADMPKPATPKIFIGYSDMTFLHSLLQQWNWRTIHGAMFWELASAGAGKSADNFHRLAAVLSGSERELRYQVKPFNRAAENLAAPVAGTLCGGNLTCLAAACGTPWALEAKGRILFIEDVSEPGYKIDRMLTQLRLAGNLDGVLAVVLGDFIKGDDATDFALKRFADGFDKPVFQSDFFGHGEKNYPLIFNSGTVIEQERDGDSSYSLRIEAGGLP